ncbi:MAG TPA: CHASE4 domain-containing protein [Methanotrichaceae archaeon]|nr:CHASE4 domain-containing protein [Methanotrichaceae archaeon]
MLSITLACLLSIYYATSQTLFLGNIHEIEEKEVRQSVQQSLEALSSEQSRLSSLASDWAAWDDTYRFIQDGNADYIESNLPDGELDLLDINFMLFISSSGGPISSDGFNLRDQTSMSVPPSLLKQCMAMSRHPNDSISGILMLPEGPILISAQPIVSSQGKGPALGTLVMGRYLDSSEINSLANMTRLSISMSIFDDPGMAADFKDAKSWLSSSSEENSFFSKPLSEDSISGYALIKDIHGMPCLILKTSISRDIYRHGKASLGYFLLMLLGAGLLFGAMMLFLLEQTVLSRLSNLSSDVSNIGLDGDLSARVSSAGDDEISSLARAVNGMMSDLEHYQRVKKKSEEDYEQLVQSANSIILRIDDHGRITFSNQYAQRFFGYTKEEIFGKSIIGTIIPEASTEGTDQEVCLEVEAQVPSKIISHPEQYLMAERESMRRNGERVWISWTSKAILDENGKASETLCIGNDITGLKMVEEELLRAKGDLETMVEKRTARLSMANNALMEEMIKRKKIEAEREHLIRELESKNSEMERFVYTVSHDLRSPLITIQGFAGFLRRDMEQGDMAKVEIDLRMVENSCAKMDHLLSNTLKLSRVGRVVNPPEDVPFSKIVQDALEQIPEEMKSRLSRISVAQELPVVHVDKMRIEEVLINFIENSIKYMGNQSSPEVDIGFSNDRGAFFVKDNGIGLDPRLKDKVFELFYKVDAKSKGTGAGLAIAKRIIEVHGGRVWIESELGKGCTIFFTLPMTG